MTARPPSVLLAGFGVTPPSDILGAVDLIAAAYGGRSTVLSVVEVPEDRSLSEGALVVRRRRTLLRKLEQLRHSERLVPEVHTSHSLEEGIRDAAQEMAAELLVLRWKSPPAVRHATDRLIVEPPCDLAVIKPGDPRPIKRVLVPARGGPHALLALRLAESIAAQNDAVLTLLHVHSADAEGARSGDDDSFFRVVRDHVTYHNVRLLQVESPSVLTALVDEAQNQDLVVMGSAARDERSSFLLGEIPETIMGKVDAMVVIVKTQEPVTAEMFGLSVETLAPLEHRSISEAVDRWFAENTFHSHEFRNLRYLVDLKERKGKTISVVLPTLNEEKTVGKILTTIKRDLVERCPLIDELIVIDSDSEDNTVEICTALGVQVFKHSEILTHYGSHAGKGEALWKSLYITRGDLVAWIDSDISGFHPKFVYGLLGPLLSESRIGFVKGFYRRPLRLGGQLLTTGGGRVTELTARPLFNLFYPELSGLVQPLAGEMAGRREVLESIPFFTGYGVETGLLIDILDRFGIGSIAQADLEFRVHRNQSLLSLSKMAFAIIQVVIKRLGDRDRIELMHELSTSMKLIHYSPTELFLEVKEIRELERPPIRTLPDYCSRFGLPEPVVSTQPA
ncbi:MAG TPA: glucosyl-3-phosphoglycerate synthase [Chloroflexota bacterium]